MMQPEATDGFKVKGWIMKAKKHGDRDVVATSWFEEKTSAIKRSLSGMSGRFNKRFFTVDMSSHLICYANASYSKRFAFIPFIHLRGVDYLKSAAQISRATPGWLHGIILTTNDRQYELWLQTKEDCDQWIRTFERAVEIGRSIQAENTNRNIAAASLLRAPSTLFVDEASPQGNISSFAP